LGRGWGFSKTKIFKETYETYLEFPEEWGGERTILFCGGGMDIFWNYTIGVFIGSILLSINAGL